MASEFKCIAELDLGKDVSATVTTEFYHELLNEVLVIGDSVVLLRGEITSACGKPPIERIDVKQSVPTGSLSKFGKHARAGYRMAVVLSNAEAGIRLLESRGYERCATPTSRSAAIAKSWGAWLGQNLSDANGVLVFGHDYEPAFIFEKTEVK